MLPSERSGFVAILGQPNAGKSTLTNLFVGSKVSIVSRKVQTTRVKTLGIVIKDQTQIILLDTPGIFTPQKTLEKSIVNNAIRTIDEADTIVLLVDLSFKDYQTSLDILKKLPKNKSVFLVFNKIDKCQDLDKDNILCQFEELYKFDGVFWISALKGEGTELLLNALCLKMPYHPWLYPEDIITDQPEAVWAAEIVREQVYQQLHEELPYEIYIEPESFERFDNGSIKICQAVVVARDGQKGIVLGHKGSRIKKIGMTARAILEEEMGCRVHLKLFVKVTENWMEKSSNLKEQKLI
ncbi:MAG: GTPase Era [Proteobacteria bacterium]|nr:GTPase Era [Pseudomonadota bacterium]